MRIHDTFPKYDLGQMWPTRIQGHPILFWRSARPYRGSKKKAFYPDHYNRIAQIRSDCICPHDYICEMVTREQTRHVVKINRRGEIELIGDGHCNSDVAFIELVTSRLGEFKIVTPADALRLGVWAQDLF